MTMAHGPGILDLFSSSDFRHSQFDTFASRTKCQLCRFLRREDLLESMNQVNRIRRLSDLVKSEKIPAVIREFNKTYLVLTALKQDTTTAIWKYLDIKVVSDRGRLLWGTLHSLQVIYQAVELNLTRPLSNILTWKYPDSPFFNFVYWRPVEWTYGYLNSLLMLRERFEYFRTNHERYPKLSTKPLPTRILRLSGEILHLSLSLHETSLDGVGEYTTLSYCWGGQQELRLMTQNLKTFKDTALTTTQLPQTLRLL